MSVLGSSTPSPKREAIVRLATGPADRVSIAATDRLGPLARELSLDTEREGESTLAPTPDNAILRAPVRTTEQSSLDLAPQTPALCLTYPINRRVSLWQPLNRLQRFETIEPIPPQVVRQLSQR